MLLVHGGPGTWDHSYFKPHVGALGRRIRNLGVGEIAAGLPPGVGRLDVLEGAGHFPWLDRPDAYWSLLSEFVTSPLR